MIPQHNIVSSSPVVGELQSAHVVLAEVTRTGGDSYVTRVKVFRRSCRGWSRERKGGWIGNAVPELIIFDPGRARIRAHNGRRRFFCNRARLIPRGTLPRGLLVSVGAQSIPLVRGHLCRIPRRPKSPFTMQICAQPPGSTIKVLESFRVRPTTSFFESRFVSFLSNARTRIYFAIPSTRQMTNDQKLIKWLSNDSDKILEIKMEREIK